MTSLTPDDTDRIPDAALTALSTLGAHAEQYANELTTTIDLIELGITALNDRGPHTGIESRMLSLLETAHAQLVSVHSRLDEDNAHSGDLIPETWMREHHAETTELMLRRWQTTPDSGAGS